MVLFAPRGRGVPLGVARAGAQDSLGPFSCPYSPNLVEVEFCEVPPCGLPLFPSNRMAGVQFGL
jgi:hypothetical protein